MKKGTHISIPKYLDILLEDELERLKGIFPKKKDSLIKAIYDGFNNDNHYSIYVDKIISNEYAAALYYDNDYITLDEANETLIYIERTMIKNNNPKVFISGTSRLYTYNYYNRDELVTQLIKYFSLSPDIRERIIFPKTISFFDALLQNWKSYYIYWLGTYDKYLEKGDNVAYCCDDPEEHEGYIKFLNFLFKNGLETELFGEEWETYVKKMEEEGYLLELFKGSSTLILLKVFESDNHTKFYMSNSINKKPVILNIKEICEYDYDPKDMELNYNLEKKEFIYDFKEHETYKNDIVYFNYKDRLDAEINIAKDKLKRSKAKGTYYEFTYDNDNRIIECIKYFKDYLKLDCKTNNKYIVYGNNNHIKDFIKLLEIE